MMSSTPTLSPPMPMGPAGSSAMPPLALQNVTLPGDGGQEAHG